MSADGFLSRWSRRKVAVQGGAVPVDEAPVATQAAPPTAPPAPVALPVDAPADDAVAIPSPPPLTMDDVAQLTPESDYTRFVAPGVDPGVCNAAMRKLFTDPHYNIMDGLDTYIEDYGIADPIPESMLRQMVQSRALGLFDHEDEKPPADVASSASDETPSAMPATLSEARTHENADLRLQPDDAAGRPGADPGAEAEPSGRG
ncbi:MAG: DUF3306 domain-containing protein [Rhizobacter sp.]